MGAFDDLVPQWSGAFDDLIPADSGEGMVKTAAKNLAAGAVGTVASGLKGLAVINADVAESPTPYASLMRQAGAAGPPEGQPSYQAGERLQRVVTEGIAPNPRYRNSFLASTLPQGLGSTVAFLPTALAGPAGIAAAGALSSGGSAYDEAKASGADDDTAHRAFWQNALAGTSEAIPLSRIFERINKASGGSLFRAVRDMLASGLEEGAQETFQQTVGNLIAQHGYDDERRVLDGVAEGGAAGFLTGALFAGAGHGAKRLLPSGQPQMDADGHGSGAAGPSGPGTTAGPGPTPGPGAAPQTPPTAEPTPAGAPGAGTGPVPVPPVPTSLAEVRRLLSEATTPEALASIVQDAGVQQAVAAASPAEQEVLTLAVQDRMAALELPAPPAEAPAESAGAFDDLVPKAEVPAATSNEPRTADTFLTPEEQAAARQELDAELGQEVLSATPGPETTAWVGWFDVDRGREFPNPFRTKAEADEWASKRRGVTVVQMPPHPWWWNDSLAEELMAPALYGVGESGAAMMPRGSTDIDRFVVFRGEADPPQILRVTDTGAGDSSRVSSSIYPVVEARLSNGTVVRRQVRISDHPQVSSRAPHEYSIDVRWSGKTHHGRHLAKALQDELAEALLDSVEEVWSEQREILSNANAGVAPGVAGTKTSLGEADKGSVGALRPEVTSALTPETERQQESEVKSAVLGATPAPTLAIETDPARRQQLKNSIAEGEMIVKSGKSLTGRKLSPGEIEMTQRAVQNSKSRLGEMPLGETPAPAPPAERESPKAETQKRSESQLSPDEFKRDAKFVRHKGKRTLFIRYGDTMVVVPFQNNGKLTRPRDEILERIHREFVESRVAMLRNDLADASPGSVASTINIARSRLSKPAIYTVSAPAVDAYGIALPEGYVRQGDQYVWQPGVKAEPQTTLATPPTTNDEPQTTAAAAAPEVARAENPPAQQRAPFDAKAAKAQKKFLLAEIDKAVAAAPEDYDFASTPQADDLRAVEALGKLGSQSVLEIESPALRNRTMELAAKHGVQLATVDPERKTETPANAYWMAQQLERAVRNEAYAAMPHVTIEIPGDGTFSIVNNRKALAAFKERAKNFPTTAAKAPAPKQARTEPTAAGPLGDLSPENVLAAAQMFVSTDDSRYVLHNVWSDGKQTVATDGRALVVIAKGSAGTEKKPVLIKDGKRTPDAKENGKFPNWRQVVPTDDSLKVGAASVNTARLFALLKQAEQALDEKTNTVGITFNHDGSLGVYAKSETGGEYASNLQPNRGWIALDVSRMQNVLRAARKLGSENVSLEWTDELSPIVVRGEKFKAVLMPMRTEKGWAAEAMQMAEAKPEPAKAPPSRPRRSRSANARAAQASPGGPIGSAPGGIGNDPQFSAFPLALPEAVEMVQALLRGKIPRLREQLRVLAGHALGVFRHRDATGDADIELRRDLWMLDDETLGRLKAEADIYAQRTEPTADAEQSRIRQEYLDHLVKEHAKSNPPTMALKVLWHEIGHLVDWLPQFMIDGRGNIFGHIAALKRWLRHSMPLGPGVPDRPLTPADKARIRREAEAELRRELGGLREIIERIVVDEPVYATLQLKPEDVKALFGMDARERTPELYTWFASQPDEVKVDIVRKAMKGILDERLGAVAGRQQVGTRRVEREVRHREGREPTQAEILERFRKNLRAEMDRRQMADLDQLKGELQGLIAWWNGTETMPDYFKTPEEMYAEAFSVFINNPAATAARAPTFYKLVHNYMGARPEVARVYAEMQDRMRQGTVMPHRVARLREMWREADEKAMDFTEARSRVAARDLLDNVLYHIDRVFGPMYRRARRARQPGDVRQAIGDYLYRAADHERFLNRSNAEVGKPLVAANLDWSDFGEYLFHKHVTESRYVRDPATGVLKPIANPYGWSADESTKRLAELQTQLGPQRWQALVDAQRAFRRIYEEMVVAPMRAEGMAGEALQHAIDSRVFYATFAAVKDRSETPIDQLYDVSFGNGVGAKIHRQVGNLGKIKNPATATVLKALSLTTAVHRNKLKRQLVALMQETDPGMVRAADTRWNGETKRKEFIVRDSETVGTLVYMRDGKPHAFYVPRQIAEMVEAGSVTSNYFTLGMMQATRGLKALFTQINAGFWPVAFARDMVGWNMQMPGLRTPIEWARLMPSSLAAARDSVRNTRANSLADEFLRRRMAISRASPAGFHDVVDNEYDLALASYGINPAQWQKEVDRTHVLARAWQWWRETGQIFERAHKIAGMQYLDRVHPGMPEWQKQEIVRERSGSPDFLQKGRSNPYVDFFAMFYNPWKEGLRSVAKAARDNPWSFTAKATGLIIAPTVLQALATAGMFGDDLEEAYRSIPDYDATNYLCIPLFWADKKNGKIAYLRLPLWEPARVLHGLLYKTLTGRGQGYASYLGGQVPGANPLITTALAWATYEVAGQNPYDAFRGQHWLNDDTLKAGGWTARKEMLKQSWNELGGGIIGTFKRITVDEPPAGTVEKGLSLPIVGNLVGRWIKVSNRGLYDRDRQLGVPVDQYRAQTRLAVRPVIEKLLTGGALTPSERVLLREPYAVEYLRNRLPKTAKERSSVLMDRLSRATTREQKAAILREEANR